MNKGNGAREKVQQYFETEIVPYSPEYMSGASPRSQHDTDRFLLWLALRGYVIVPFDNVIESMRVEGDPRWP